MVARQPLASAVPLALLVDRDADTRQMYAEFLRHERYETEEAEDGREALAKAISLQPAIVVTETRLPGMSGLELCRVLRTDLLTRSIPLIVLTSDGLGTSTQVAHAAGADLVLVKPCLPGQLEAEIKQLLERSRELRLHASEVRGRIAPQLAKSKPLLDWSQATQDRVMLNRAHRRHATSEPPVLPLPLVCPDCDRPLVYVVSQVGGVNAKLPEQWDYFECAACRTRYEYRHRTRRLRRYTLALPGPA